MTCDYIIQFLPIICIAFSALIGAFGYWFKLRFERRRSVDIGRAFFKLVDKGKQIAWERF